MEPVEIDSVWNVLEYRKKFIVATTKISPNELEKLNSTSIANLAQFCLNAYASKAPKSAKYYTTHLQLDIQPLVF